MFHQSFAYTMFAATTAPEDQSAISGGIVLLIVAAIFVLPFVVGNLLGKWLKLKDIGFRISVVLLAFTLGLTPFVYQGLAAKAERQAYAAELKHWEQKGQKYQVTEEGVEELKEALPDCNIRF